MDNFAVSIDQSINRSINQLINRSFSRPINQSINLLLSVSGLVSVCVRVCLCVHECGCVTSTRVRASLCAHVDFYIGLHTCRKTHSLLHNGWVACWLSDPG